MNPITHPKHALLYSLLLGALFMMGCPHRNNNEHEAGAIIGPEGGTIEVESESSAIYGAAIVIPEDGLAEDTYFGLDPVEPTTEIPAEFEYSGPGVSVFSYYQDYTSNGEVYLPYDSSKKSDDGVLIVGIYNPADSSWDTAPVIEMDEERQIVHAIATDIAGKKFFPIWFEDNKSQKGWPVNIGFDLEEDRFPISNFNGNWCSPEGNTKYNSPGGYCYGIAAYTQWYFAEMRDSLGSLHDYPGYDGRHIVTVHGFLGQLHFRDSQEQ